MQTLDIRPFVDSMWVDDQSAQIHLSLNIINGRTARIPEILSNILHLTDEEIALTRVKRRNLLIQFGEII